MLDPQDIRVTNYLPHRGYGAGGQHVGLTVSGIIAHHLPTGIGVSCDSERSQHANKNKAIEMLERVVQIELFNRNSELRQISNGPCQMPQGHPTHCGCGGFC